MLDIIEHADGIRELRIAAPPVNALNPALIRSIRQAIEAAPGDGVQALVLSGAPGIFSAGLDVPALLALGRDELPAVWDDFFGIFGALARSPIPVAAAITGHSPAGGAVMAVFCDYRVMADGPFRIGLNEVQVGLVAPDCVQIGLRRLVGAYRAERLLVAGQMITAQEAHAIGLVDELLPPDQVLPRAIVWLQQLLALPRRAMLATRAIARADIIAAYADPAALRLDQFTEDWFAPATQQALHAMVARVKAR
ncbi:Enoyl-CoA hydratase/carnithine racemase [Andreprevotia lacus DSM 23236]|uniref:Enoyl-CoA hydratase/carnithine racemase n=1 Tax=Andreprevotia lacus DSM 23236 TaxID=1121001 RepID=A0A1W1XWX7_9NEIS|nr:enoyl-CoA hydratase/isomerase family protein [Andreprevotia lacus]SMC28031.1 Enoyl-CoA hydratase/carnithine racemase [Andreprevotia lacus DSM 23236]